MKKDESCHESCRWLHDEIKTNATLLHELQVQHIELEMQNRQLREAQQELEETRDRYADLYDFAPVGYMTLDESGIVLEINLTGAAILGVERLNVTGKSFINFLPPASIQTFSTYLRHTFENPGKRESEIRIRSKVEGTRLVSMVSMVSDEATRKCRIVMNDITVQRKNDIELQISRSARDALLSAIPALIYYLDINLRLLIVSHAFADFVGRSAEDIVGMTVYDLFPDEVAAELHNVAYSVMQTGMALYGFENNMPDAGGNIVHLSTMLAPFRDSKGDIIGLVGVSTDITTIKHMLYSNGELLVQNRTMTRNLLQAQEQERRYLARELHDELGQWFTAIQTETQIILNIEKHDPVIRESVLAISKSASAAHEVIRGMVRQLRPSLLDELGLADSLRELQRHWSITFPELVCELNLDVALEGLGEELNITLYRVVQESLNNVARHAHARQVSVSVQRGKVKSGEASYIELKIEDDGAGFDSKEMRGGTGLLGMRERVIAAGGLFFIESAADTGTKIEAKLPIIAGGTENKRGRK